MRKLEESLRKQKRQTRQEVPQLSGILGIPIDGKKRVEVPNRNSYVYVRLRNNQSEVIQAFNNRVAPSYNLPVLVERQGNRYIIASVDTQRYENNWGSFSPFLARHGNTHSFDPDSGGGGDTVWVQTRQFMPLLAVPSGSSGGPNVVISPYLLRSPSSTWMYVGNTGTRDITGYKPTGSSAVMALVYLDSVSGNPNIIVGSGSYFAATITGAAAVTPYIPVLTNPDWIPLMAVRLVSGTNAIGWDNLYDARQFLHNTPTGSAGGSSPGSSFDNFWTSGTNGAYNVRQKSDSQPTVMGDYSVAVGIGHYVSGSTNFAEGGSNTIAGAQSHAEGSSNIIEGNSNHAEGALNHIVGDNNHIEGGSNHIYGDNNHAEGSESMISGSFSFVSGVANENLARFSMILGGSGSKLSPAALGSVMIGVTNYTGTEPNTEYVNKLNIRRLHGAAPIANVGISSLGFLVTGTAGGGGTVTGSYMGENGWMPALETWVRTSNTTFVMSGDVSAKYRKGSRLYCKDVGNTDYYNVILDSGFTSGTTTTVTVFYGGVGTVGIPNGGTFVQQISYVEHPQGFPEEYTWNVTWGNLSVGNGTLVAKLYLSTACFLEGYISLVFGSSTSISGSVSFTLPVATLQSIVNSLQFPLGIVQALDSSANTSYACLVRTSNGTAATLHRQLIPTTNLTISTFSATQPFSWDTGDTLVIPFRYQF